MSLRMPRAAKVGTKPLNKMPGIHERKPIQKKAKENIPTKVFKRKAVDQVDENKATKKRSALGEITNAIGKSFANRKNVAAPKKKSVKIPSAVLGLAGSSSYLRSSVKVFDIEEQSKKTIEELEKDLDLSYDEKNQQKTPKQSNAEKSEYMTPNESIAHENKSVKEIPDGVCDFDKETKDDPAAAALYAFNIFEYYKTREAKFLPSDYMENQPEINRRMRIILVDWLVEVQESFELNHETLYLAVRLVDLYLSKAKVGRDNLQLVGAACVYIACKFDERIPPLLDDFLFICDDAYTRDELLEMERTILKKVDFDLGMPLSYRYLRRYARCGKITLEKLTYARYILEVSLMHYEFVRVSESKKAAAALCLALHLLNEECWTKTIEYYSGFSLNDIQQCVMDLHKMLLKFKPEHQKTIHSKYSHSVFFGVAETPVPAQIDLKV